MMLDWNINVGQIITIGTLLFAAAGFYYRQLFDSRTFKSDISEIKEDLKMLNKLVMDVALQNARIDNLGQSIVNMQRDIHELRRGEGYITPQR